MVEVYNYFIGGYIPKVSPKTNVHDRKELKNKYKSIVSLNNANPLAMIRLSPDTQIYALDVKEISMEMGEAAQNITTFISSIPWLLSNIYSARYLPASVSSEPT